jgi:polyisoprenoid-binding protein YceI
MHGQRPVVLLRAIISSLSCVLAFAAPVAAQRRAVDAERSTITVRVFKSGLFAAFADNHVIHAPLTEGSVEESSTPHVELVIDAAQMRVWDPGLSSKQREDVRTRMLGPQVLDASRFTLIRFHSTEVESAGLDRWLVRGNLELHGHSQPLAVVVSRERRRYKGSLTLRQTEFGITPISIAGGVVKVKDEITIEFDIVTVDQSDS